MPSEPQEMPRYVRCDDCTDVFCGYLIEHFHPEFEDCNDECETATTLDRYIGENAWIDATIRDDDED